MNRVVVITGGAKGIGFGCARRFCEDGYKVVIADIDEVSMEQALDSLSAYSDNICSVKCDVSDELSVHNLVAQALNHFGGIDVLINNAGILHKGGILDLETDDFDRVMSVNLRGAYLVSRAVVKYMVNEIESREDRSRLTERPYSIINMSSINDRVAIDGILAYAISKGGIKQLTTAMSIELAPYGIRVNGIGPGSVVTDMLGNVASDPDALASLVSRTPLGRPAQPDEIASIASFLASEDASYITGQIIYADGGRLALNNTMPPKATETD